jgi:hypothetical protein
LWESLKERDHWENQGIDGRMAGGGVWSYFSWQDRDWWQAVANVVMNLRVLAPQSKLVSKGRGLTLINVGDEFYGTWYGFRLRN